MKGHTITLWQAPHVVAPGRGAPRLSAATAAGEHVGLVTLGPDGLARALKLTTTAAGEHDADAELAGQGHRQYSATGFGHAQAGPGGETISVTYTHQTQGPLESFTHTVSSDATGGFSDSIVPNDPGNWQAQASLAGDATHQR